MKKLNKKGFTIVELVIVIAVIAILAAVLIPTFSGVIDKAQESKAVQEARNAYTQYVLELDLKQYTPEADLFFHSENYCVHIVDGSVTGTTKVPNGCVETHDNKVLAPTNSPSGAKWQVGTPATPPSEEPAA